VLIQKTGEEETAAVSRSSVARMPLYQLKRPIRGIYTTYAKKRTCDENTTTLFPGTKIYGHNHYIFREIRPIPAALAIWNVQFYIVNSSVACRDGHGKSVQWLTVQAGSRVILLLNYTRSESRLRHKPPSGFILLFLSKGKGLPVTYQWLQRGKTEVQVYPFSTSALYGGVRSTPRYWRFPPREGVRMTPRAGLDGCEAEKISCTHTGVEPQTTQPVASRCDDDAIPKPYIFSVASQNSRTI
jgi:hypothetical protein